MNANSPRSNPAAGDDHPNLEALQAHCRKQLAGYKVPRALHVVAEIARTPAGKADYAWARAVIGA